MGEPGGTPPTEGQDNPLAGLKEYLLEHQMDSVFEKECVQGGVWTLFLHDGRRLTGTVSGNDKYEFDLSTPDGLSERIHKVHVNILCREPDAAEVLKQLKSVANPPEEPEGPHFHPRYRHHIKNKTLYPLMNRKEVLFFTMLRGEVLRGVVQGFSRYEISLSMKRGVPVVLLRHAVLDVRDKKDRSYLKKAVEKAGKYW